MYIHEGMRRGGMKGDMRMVFVGRAVYITPIQAICSSETQPHARM